jgi:hypothetical protein
MTEQTPAVNDEAAVNALARILIAEWERVEGPVTASYVANFADMARAALPFLSQQVGGSDVDLSGALASNALCVAADQRGYAYAAGNASDEQLARADADFVTAVEHIVGTYALSQQVDPREQIGSWSTEIATAVMCGKSIQPLLKRYADTIRAEAFDGAAACQRDAAITGGLQTWLSAAVRDRLTTSGVTQADTAAYLGISQKHLSQMLTGAVEGSLGMWDRLLTFVDVDIHHWPFSDRDDTARVARETPLTGGGEKCASCTYPDAFPTSHADWCVTGKVLAVLGPPDDDWRWGGESLLRSKIRAALSPAPEGEKR